MSAPLFDGSRYRPKPVPAGPLDRPAPRQPKPPKPLKARNEKRAAKRHAESFGDQAALCRRRACSVPGCRVRPCVPHHETSRGAGGKDSACVPLCWPHHDECHHGQLTFERAHGIDLGEIAAGLAAELEARPAHDCEEHARLIEDGTPGRERSFYRCEKCGYVLPDEQDGEDE